MTLILLGGLVCKNGFSQSPAMDDSTAIERMLEELQQLRERNLKGAFEFSKQIERRAEKIHYQKGVWKARIEKGLVCNALGQADSAIYMINLVLEETRKQKDRLSEIRAHLGLARIYEHNFKLQPGVDHLMQAEKLLDDNDPFDVRFDILNMQGIIHRLMKDYTSALKYYKKIEDQYFEKLSPKQKFFLSMNQGNVFAEQKEYSKAEALFKKAYAVIMTINSPDNQALITYNLGALFYRQNRFEESREYVTKALEANNIIGNRVKIERCYRVLGAICFDQGDYAKANEYYYTALEIAQSLKNPNAMMGNYKNLYLSYWNLGYYNKNIGDLDKALSYYKKYATIKDSLYQIETTAKVLELEKQYETEKKNTQIALLEKENQHQLDQIVMERTRRNYMILIIILVSCTLGVFAYFVYYYKKSNQLLNAQGKSIVEQKNRISEQNTQLQKLLNTQNRLFSIIAHDLRSPLVSLFNISSIVAYHIEDKEYEALEQTAEKMNHKITKILALTDNLLNWAYSQREDFEPLMAPLSIHEIMDECLEIYKPIATDKNITIHCPRQKDLLIWADQNMIRTICRNLMNNAIKFTHPNGTIHMGYEPNDRNIRIFIKDSGVGMDTEKLKRLFEIGQEKISTDTTGEKSSGLGLSICKEFIDAMNGRIWAESEKGKGSRFTFELMAYQPQIHHSKPRSVKKQNSAACV